MFGLVIRIMLLAAVVFGVAYGLTRSRKAARFAKVTAEIQQEIARLKAGLEEGLYSDDEYRRLTEKIRQQCSEVGIEVPDLPPRVRPTEDGERDS